jgi:hypothetical protein
VVAVESREDGRGGSALRRLVGTAVRIGDVDVGRISDVLLDRRLAHVLGFVVAGSGPHGRLFLPWVAAVVEDDRVSARSTYSLLSTSELAFYVDNGLRLTDQLNAGLDDLVVDRRGDVVSVSHGAGRRDLGPPPVRGAW